MSIFSEKSQGLPENPLQTRYCAKLLPIRESPTRRTVNASLKVHEEELRYVDLFHCIS